MKKETKEWFKIALEDLEAAECLMDKGLFRMVCYHSQQAVEKTLKAVFLNSIYRARYPAALGLLPDGEPQRIDAEKALSIAKRVSSIIEEGIR